LPYRIKKKIGEEKEEEKLERTLLFSPNWEAKNPLTK